MASFVSSTEGRELVLHRKLDGRETVDSVRADLMAGAEAPGQGLRLHPRCPMENEDLLRVFQLFHPHHAQQVAMG